MAIVRNKLLAEDNVLVELKQYSAALKDNLTEVNKSIVRITESVSKSIDSADYSQQSIGFAQEMLASRKNQLAEPIELLIAVEAMLRQNPITKEQQALLIKDLNSNKFDEATKQFISSYLENYTEAKELEAKEFEINEKAKAFFENAKGNVFNVKPVTTSVHPKEVDSNSTNKRKP